MQEAEVSLRIAKYYLETEKLIHDVEVAIDGAQIKTNDTVNFQLTNFLNSIGFYKETDINSKWQGKYSSSIFNKGIIVHSTPGKGDVIIRLAEGKVVIVESKGFSNRNKSSQEYSRMREAIGQLMTNTYNSTATCLAVGVPKTSKSHELALTWSQLPLIKVIGLKFILVAETGDIEII